ncbi:transketolase [Enterococcus sp. BWB1-3]|uniref:transketolase n=1 Tax=Enterococcus sp. BWB1-3 TaxID=2787713 RepID=UPI001921B46A|nr:transketolase [Enterococcus sp. BWB1-3]MBL1230419.1 transketolase [Enterococcus sp. BWB1-3]
MIKEIENRAIAGIRSLAIDIVEKANSGHPGMPMGAAPMAYTLWAKQMKYAPTVPNWINRDRFILAAGHGSALLYSLMYLFGYEEMTVEELKQFRQLGSKTPGHPEYLHTAGIDATSGPLGQGIAMSVGMAIAEAHLSETYNKKELNLIDHYTYALCGDGDLMEGVTSEASSLAGHLKLGKLIVLYDSNDISLDGKLSHSFSEDVQKRYESYGWQILRVENGNDIESIDEKIKEAKANLEQPTLIEIRTTIGFGSPNKAGASSSHGAPLGAEEAAKTKDNYGWSEEPFVIPEDILEHTRAQIATGKKLVEEWNRKLEEYQEKYPKEAKEFEQAINFSYDLSQLSYPDYEAGQTLATRVSSGKVLNQLAVQIPSMIGGSADLSSSNKTYLANAGDFSSFNYRNRNIWFGVREFGMAAISNGMQLHGGLQAFCSTFFVFSDYLRPAIRMSALMKLPVTYIFTHDSIAVGEDGPTHEPIEHLAAIRAMPDVDLIRPAEGKEVIAAWKACLSNREEPTILALTRQDLPTLSSDQKVIDAGVSKGAYIVSEAGNNRIDGLLLATGSEVHLVIEAQKKLEEEGSFVRVVSMPSWNRFEKQSKEYKESILPEKITKRLAVEMGSKFGWREYIGREGEVLSIDRYGASAPAELLMESFGFTVENVVNKYRSL